MKLFLTTILLGMAAMAIEPTTVDHNQAPQWTPGVLNYSYRQPLPFKQWKSEALAEAAALMLYPSYKEPMRDKEKDGMVTRVEEEQTVFVARSTFIVDQPVTTINVQNIVTLETLKKIDASFEHTQISQNQLFKNKDGKPHNAGRDWCSNAASLCVQSKWKYPVYLGKPFKLVMSLLGKEGKDEFQQTQSEILPVAPAELAKFSSLIGTKPVAVVEQSIFYVNQVMRWGKNVIIFHAGPNNQTHVTVYSTVAIASEYYNMRKAGISLSDYLLQNKFNLGCNGGLVSGMTKLSSCAATSLLEILKK